MILRFLRSLGINMSEVTPKNYYRVPSNTIERSWHCVPIKSVIFNIPSSPPMIGSKWHEMHAWCEENCSGKWSYAGRVASYKFYFKTRRDYTLFTLTWVD